MIDALAAIPSATTLASPRAAQAADGHSFADAMRRTALDPIRPLASHDPSPRAASAEGSETFSNLMQRTSKAPIDPAPPQRDVTPKRAAEDPFGRGYHDRMRYTGALPLEKDPGADPARTAAEELVAITLIQPILKSLRESNMAAEPFGPGDAERRFGPMWDATIAHEMVKSRGFGLVDEVARRVRQHGNGAERSAAPAEDPANAYLTSAAIDARRNASSIDLGA